MSFILINLLKNYNEEIHLPMAAYSKVAVRNATYLYNERTSQTTTEEQGRYNSTRELVQSPA
jgi:hypothetical protein